MVSSGKSAKTRRLGLIAGKGSLPEIVCRTAAQRGVKTTAVTFHKETTKSLENLAEVTQMGIGEVNKIIDHFKSSGIKKICLIGKIEKKLVFQKVAIDMRALGMIKKAMSKSDSALMLTVIEELEKEGFEVTRQTDWLKDLLPEKGILGKIRPDGKMESDFSFGLKVCRECAGMDIGQTVIVKEGTVLSVEAVEGTNEAIKRGCKLGRAGAVMIKTSRPNQDLRFDIPSIGPETVNLLAKYKAAGIGIEAKRTVVVDMPEVISICNRAGIVFAAL